MYFDMGCINKDMKGFLRKINIKSEAFEKNQETVMMHDH